MKGAAALLLLVAGPALAHGGAHEVEPGPPGWTFDPLIVVPLLAAAALYAIGSLRLARRSSLEPGTWTRDRLLFAAGWIVLAGSLVSPLHEGGERSFTLHMIEHELIMLAAALLLVAARPGPTMLWALPRAARRAVGGFVASRAVARPWRFFTDPVVATVLQAIALVAWHLPALFDRALGHEGWHIAQHLSFLATALLFWWAMAHGKGGFGVSALCLLATSMVGGMLGALMSFSGSPWYAGYAAMEMMPFGLTPVEDQQLAGLLMWIPGGLFHLVAALFFVSRWLRAAEARDAVAAD